MKKLFSTLIVFAIMIIGCGDETTVKGYTDEDVQNIFSIFKGSSELSVEHFSKKIA